MSTVKNFTPPAIIHKITDFYKNIYKLNKKLPKQDRFGIGKKIEDECLACLNLTIAAALSNKETKIIETNMIPTKNFFIIPLPL